MLLSRHTSFDTPLGRLDPRVKILMLVGASITSFFITDAVTGLFMAALLVFAYVLAHVPAAQMLRTVKPFLWIFVFSFVVNVLVIRGGAVLFEWGPIVVSVRGVELGILVAYRAVIALGFGVLLVATTSPVHIADALERLLAPLRLFRVPVEDVAMILSIALRTIPLLSDEASQVAMAQRSRGVQGFDKGILSRMKSYASLVVPLLEGSLRHAERLAVAMDARCYAASQHRTHLHPLRFARSDYLACAASCMLVACFIGLRIVLQ